jgi:triosephosphate isomerase
MQRVPFFAGNWKMHKTITEAIQLANEIKRELYQITDAEVVLCPSFTALSEVSEVINESNIKLGAQNVFYENEGAYTGEISPVMLKDLGCIYVIVGHSERRRYFKETDDMINKKIKLSLFNKLLPIFCIGETLDERKDNKTFDVISTQILNGLKDISSSDIKDIIIAYEPVWAIGTGVNATPQQAEEVHIFIRKKLKELYNEDIAEMLTILYGGSVKPETIEELMKEEDIDGVLVGGASLKADSFLQIVKKGLDSKLGGR